MSQPPGVIQLESISENKISHSRNAASSDDDDEVLEDKFEKGRKRLAVSARVKEGTDDVPEKVVFSGSGLGGNKSKKNKEDDDDDLFAGVLDPVIFSKAPKKAEKDKKKKKVKASSDGDASDGSRSGSRSRSRTPQPRPKRQRKEKPEGEASGSAKKPKAAASFDLVSEPGSAQKHKQHAALTQASKAIVVAKGLVDKYKDVALYPKVTIKAVESVKNELGKALSQKNLDLYTTRFGDDDTGDNGMKALEDLRAAEAQVDAVLPLQQSLLATEGDHFDSEALLLRCKAALAVNVPLPGIPITEVIARRYCLRCHIPRRPSNNKFSEHNTYEHFSPDIIY